MGDAATRTPSEIAGELVAFFAQAGLSLATAESCTGGLVAAALSGVPGASRVLWGGLVTYSNESKERLLGVSRETLETQGAVSRQCAREMAAAARALSGADAALAVTGIAGPSGATADKPVGLVWFAFQGADGSAVEESRVFPGDRDSVRRAASAAALEGALGLGRRLADSVRGDFPETGLGRSARCRY